MGALTPTPLGGGLRPIPTPRFSSERKSSGCLALCAGNQKKASLFLMFVYFPHEKKMFKEVKIYAFPTTTLAWYLAAELEIFQTAYNFHVGGGSRWEGGSDPPPSMLGAESGLPLTASHTSPQRRNLGSLLETARKEFFLVILNFLSTNPDPEIHHCCQNK